MPNMPLNQIRSEEKLKRIYPGTQIQSRPERTAFEFLFPTQDDKIEIRHYPIQQSSTFSLDLLADHLESHTSTIRSALEDRQVVYEILPRIDKIHAMGIRLSDVNDALLTAFGHTQMLSLRASGSTLPVYIKGPEGPFHQTLVKISVPQNRQQTIQVIGLVDVRQKIMPGKVLADLRDKYHVSIGQRDPRLLRKE